MCVVGSRGAVTISDNESADIPSLAHHCYRAFA